MILKNDKDKRSVCVQCHPGFGYEEFIEGLKPIGLTNGTINLEIVNGEFKDLCINAKKACLSCKNKPECDNSKFECNNEYIWVW